jgi:hypothetical protein
VPGEQEIGDAAGLAGVAPGDRAQAAEGFEGSGFDGEHSFQNRATNFGGFCAFLSSLYDVAKFCHQRKFKENNNL